ncbi:MAG: c-type cytochrome [Acidobacteriota bacterium]|nr:c-type cytochrome [Acidobacteriota bacterium]
MAPLSAQNDQTIWDGVFTEPQAARGREHYVETCGYCHRDDLSGGGSEAGAPALAGPFFMNQWRGRPVADLFVTIGTTMPKQNPDSLRAQVVIDIVSFLLQANHAPVGDQELPPRLEPLGSILLTAAPRR